VALLAVESLKFGYGRAPVLRGVSLAAERGECLVLFGANGSGKSTLLGLMSTLLRAQSGRYCLDGVDAGEDPEAIRRRVVYLGHNTHLYGHLTARENLRFFSDLRGDTGMDPASGDDVLSACGLARFADRPVRSFSAGMRKRLALGRMLLAPSALLWLLDEPYSALDASGVAWLNGLLLGYLSQGGMVVLVTHDPDRVSALPMRACHLQGGLLATGSVEASC
jgi:heme exporter protein A